MRAIGQAEKALEMMCRRGLSREAFGKRLTDLEAIMILLQMLVWK